MRFSILIPTRNRLEYLRHAVETVLRQSYGDWEIVIADNASVDDVAGYVQELADRRIRYTRTDELISVTDNWNRALDLSSGDYVIMLGDDDGLMQDALVRLDGIARQFSEPDALYMNTYLFAYPGALAEFPDGYLQPYGYPLFLRNVDEPFILPREEAARLARDAMRFHARYGFNMQFVATSRRMVERMKQRSSFYLSPYPDYFAMNAIFLTAEKIVVCPERLVMIGISPKSYGHLYKAGRGSVADQILASFPDVVVGGAKEHLLPGDSVNNGWLLAMDALQQVYGRELGIGVDYQRYRKVQMLAAARENAAGRLPREVRDEMKAKLKPRERLYFTFASISSAIARSPLLAPIRRPAAALWQRIGPALRGGTAQFVPWNPPKIVGRYQTVVDVFENVQT